MIVDTVYNTQNIISNYIIYKEEQIEIITILTRN